MSIVSNNQERDQSRDNKEEDETWGKTSKLNLCLRTLIVVLILLVPITLIIVYNDFGCPVESITGPDFKDFMTILGQKNEMHLTI